MVSPLLGIIALQEFYFGENPRTAARETKVVEKPIEKPRDIIPTPTKQKKIIQQPMFYEEDEDIYEFEEHH